MTEEGKGPDSCCLVEDEGARSTGVEQWQRVLLLVILAGAALLRFWNLDFGLPRFYHPDEQTKVLRVLWPMLRDHTLDPRYFNHPAFLLYSTGAVGLTRSALTGEEISGDLMLLSGRTVSAVMGTFTVFLVFLLGRRLAGAWCGLVAAALLAASPLHVQCSHYMKEDVAVTAWATLQLLLCVRYVQDGRRRDLFLAGAFTGMATATKYVGALSAVSLLAACLLRWRLAGLREAWRGVVRDVAICGALACVVFVAVNPYALLNAQQFRTGVNREAVHARRGHFRGRLAAGPWRDLWTYHLRRSLIPGMGLMVVGLGVAGSVWALRRRDRAACLVVLAGAVGYLVQESSPLKPPPQPERYMVLVLPMVAVMAAYFVAQAATACRRRAGGNRPCVVLAGVLVAAMLAPPLLDSVRNVASMKPDTRDLASAWLAENCPAGSKVMLVGVPNYCPRVPESCEALYTAWIFRDLSDGETGELRRTAFDLESRTYDALDDDLPPIVPDYMVISSFWYMRYVDPRNRHEAGRYYGELIPRHLGEPVSTFSSPHGSYGFNNPEIRIYDLRRTQGADPS